MCYSNCKNENYHGECTKRIDKYDTSLHCFEGFKCDSCGEIFLDTEFLSDDEKQCKECYEIENINNLFHSKKDIDDTKKQ